MYKLISKGKETKEIFKKCGADLQMEKSEKKIILETNSITPGKQSKVECGVEFIYCANFVKKYHP